MLSDLDHAPTDSTYHGKNLIYFPVKVTNLARQLEGKAMTSDYSRITSLITGASSWEE